MKQSTKTTNRAFMHNNIPYRYCYEEGGMIEIEKDIYTGSYEIVPPNKEMKGSYNSKMTKMIMEEILQKLAEKFSFQFTIRNRYRDKEEYLASVMIDEKGAGDAYSHLKNLYNNVLQENCDIGHNNFAHKKEDELLAQLDYLWNYAVQRKKKNSTVWIFVDSVDELIYSTTGSDYLISLLERADVLKTPITLVVEDA